MPCRVRPARSGSQRVAALRARPATPPAGTTGQPLRGGPMLRQDSVVRRSRGHSPAPLLTPCPDPTSAPSRRLRKVTTRSKYQTATAGGHEWARRMYQGWRGSRAAGSLLAHRAGRYRAGAHCRRCGRCPDRLPPARREAYSARRGDGEAGDAEDGQADRPARNRSFVWANRASWGGFKIRRGRRVPARRCRPVRRGRSRRASPSPSRGWPPHRIGRCVGPAPTWIR